MWFKGTQGRREIDGTQPKTSDYEPFRTYAHLESISIRMPHYDRSWVTQVMPCHMLLYSVKTRKMDKSARIMAEYVEELTIFSHYSRTFVHFTGITAIQYHMARDHLCDSVSIIMWHSTEIDSYQKNMYMISEFEIGFLNEYWYRNIRYEGTTLPSQSRYPLLGNLVTSRWNIYEVQFRPKSN